MQHALAARRSIGGVLGASAGGAAAFVGAYDAIPSIVAAYGMRLLLSSHYGSPLVRLRRASDNAEDDIGHAPTGDLDVAAAAAFIGGGSGLIKNWYDQSGNIYTAAQATPGSQPLYVASGQNGRPVGRGDGIDDHLTLSFPTAGASGYSFLATIIMGPTIPYSIALGSNDTAGIRWSMMGTGNTNPYYLGYGGVASVPFGGTPWAINTAYVRSALKSPTAWSTFVNAASAGTNPSDASMPTGNFNVAIWRESAAFAAYHFPGDISELIICNAALSTADRQAAEAAANAYWNIF